MWIENTWSEPQNNIDLHDLSWVVREGTELFSKMEWLMGNVDNHIHEVAESNDEKVLSLANMRLWFNFEWVDDNMRNNIVSVLERDLRISV